MERDLEDLKTRMRQALENPKKVAEVAVAALRIPYNAYKVVLESTKDKQLAQDWRNTLMLKRDQEQYGVSFSEELASVFSELNQDKRREEMKGNLERLIDKIEKFACEMNFFSFRPEYEITLASQRGGSTGYGASITIKISNKALVEKINQENLVSSNRTSDAIWICGGAEGKLFQEEALKRAFQDLLGKVETIKKGIKID